MKQHIRIGKLDPEELSNVKITEVKGGKLMREIAEHRRIEEIVKEYRSNDLSVVENKRWPIGPKRRHLIKD